MDYSNIPTGLKITSQIPLDVKKYVKDEDTLAYLGVDDNLAYTYHDQLEVLCLAEKKIYQWREVQSGEENTGLVPLDFTYPTGLLDVYGINYSGKKYNFFLKEYATSDMIVEQKDIVSPNGSVTITETPTQIQLTVPETKIINGLQTTVTGTGTTLNPYKIDGKLYQAGDNISITGSGTTLSPYIISVNNTNGNVGWLKGDTKEVVCDDTYIRNNFTSSGLGINERAGWVILNGATHVIDGEEIDIPNDNGRVVIGYNTTYDPIFPPMNILNARGGNFTHTLTIDEMPNHGHNWKYGLEGDDDDTGGSYKEFTQIPGIVDSESTISPIAKTGGGQPHNNMQPYVVRLRIMKL